MGEPSARYSPLVSDDFTSAGPTSSAPPPVGANDTPKSGRRASSGAAGWLIATVVVLVLAIAGGLFTAWMVANMRAVPGPVAGASPTPTSSLASAPPSASAGASGEPTDAPRRTPTAVPTVEVTAAPFMHVVQKGESLTYIAGLYQVDPQDIIDLNGIKNPNRIAVGQELLIPGYGIQPTPKPTKPPK